MEQRVKKVNIKTKRNESCVALLLFTARVSGKGEQPRHRSLPMSERLCHRGARRGWAGLQAVARIKATSVREFWKSGVKTEREGEGGERGELGVRGASL